MTRKVLPQRRHTETREIWLWGQRWTVSVGYYDKDLREIGEFFISCGKSGEQTEAIARDSAILLSLALQHGCPLETIKHAISRNADGSPGTIVGAIVDILESPPGPGEQGSDAKELP